MTTATETKTKTFEQVYADAVNNDLTDEQMYKQRQLHWHGERIPLSEAAELYAKISHGYNEFRPDMIGMLQTEFPAAGIEATPAREGSVAIYLHIPDEFEGQVLDFVQKFFSADEVDTVTVSSCLQDGESELKGKALRIWWD